MKLLVTGSAGHLGEALMRTLPLAGHEPFGLDVKESAFTHRVGSIVDRGLVRVCVRGMDAIIHTATLHKPHVATHTRRGRLLKWRHRDSAGETVSACTAFDLHRVAVVSRKCQSTSTILLASCLLLVSLRP